MAGGYWKGVLIEVEQEWGGEGKGAGLLAEVPVESELLSWAHCAVLADHLG